MDLLETMLTRRSCRAFKDETVTREVLEPIVSAACRAPSALNMQPWEVNLVLNEERKRLSRVLTQAFRERGLTCGPGARRELAPRFMERARQCGDGMAPLIQEMGSDFRTFVNEGSLNFYGAPAAALIFLDESFSPERTADVGAFVGYMVLAAAGYGLASCPIGLVAAYEDEIRDHLNIPESQRLIVSVALGHPDQDSPINRFRSPRGDLREFVRWVD